MMYCFDEVTDYDELKNDNRERREVKRRNMRRFDNIPLIACLIIGATVGFVFGRHLPAPALYTGGDKRVERGFSKLEDNNRAAERITDELGGEIERAGELNQSAIDAGGRASGELQTLITDLENHIDSERGDSGGRGNGGVD
jgi:hypothetical protein